MLWVSQGDQGDQDKKVDNDDNFRRINSCLIYMETTNHQYFGKHQSQSQYLDNKMCGAPYRYVREGR